MFRYFTLRTEQQLFCYLYGGALALFLTLLYPSFPAWAGPLLVMLPVALFWAGLALYTRHTDQMRTLEVSPLVCIRDGVQVVAMLPHHEKARLNGKFSRTVRCITSRCVTLSTWWSGLSPGDAFMRQQRYWQVRVFWCGDFRRTVSVW